MEQDDMIYEKWEKLLKVRGEELAKQNEQLKEEAKRFDDYTYNLKILQDNFVRSFIKKYQSRPFSWFITKKSMDNLLSKTELRELFKKMEEKAKYLY